MSNEMYLRGSKEDRDKSREERVISSAVETADRTNNDRENDVSCLTTSGFTEKPKPIIGKDGVTDSISMNSTGTQSNNEKRRCEIDSSYLSLGWLQEEDSQPVTHQQQLSDTRNHYNRNNDNLPQYKDQAQSTSIQEQTIRQNHPDFVTSRNNTSSCIDAEILSYDSLDGTVFDDEGNIIIRNRNIPQNFNHSAIPMAEAIAMGCGNSSSSYSQTIQVDERAHSTAPHLADHAAGRPTTTESSNATANTKDNNSLNKNTKYSETIEVQLRKMVIEAVRIERKFWIRLIMAAIILNTLLVGVIITVGFCASGKCSTRQESNSSDPFLTSASPPALALDSSMDEDSAPTKDTYASAMPTDARYSISTGSLIGIAVVFEALIISCLVIYFRRWQLQKFKQQQKMQELASRPSLQSA